MKNKFFWGKLGSCLVTGLLSSSLQAQFINQSYSTKGDMINHTAPHMGRLAVIETLGDYTLPFPNCPAALRAATFLFAPGI